MKRISSVVLGILIILFPLSMSACGEKEALIPLSAPDGFELSSRTIMWDEVEDAAGYVVAFGDKEERVDIPVYSLSSSLEYGDYEISVLALGDYETFEDSEWSKWKFTLQEPPEIVRDANMIGYTLLPDGSGYVLTDGCLSGNFVKGSITIPSHISDLPVKEIAAYAFTYPKVYYDEGYKSGFIIDSYSDCHCNAVMEQVILPSTIEKIGERAFANVTHMEEIVIPDSVKEIGAMAFQGCVRLKRVKLPNELKSISAECFEDCDLEKITIPNSVEAIDWGAFMGHDYDDVNHGSQFTNPNPKLIDHTMLNLKKVVIPSGVKTIGKLAFSDCPNLSEVVISDGVKKICGLAFSGCKNLVKITLPKSVDEIERNAFATTPWIESFPADEPIVFNGILYDYNGILPESYTVPENIKGFVQGALNRPMSICKEIYFPDGVKLAKSLCPESLERVRLPADLTVIPNSCFSACNLKEIEFPDSVTLIGEAAFSGCLLLERLELPKNLETIEDQAFDGCSLLETIEFPDTVKTIGDWAFRNCSALKEVKLSANLEVLGIYAFAHTQLTEIIIPHSLKVLGATPFPQTMQRIYYEGTASEWMLLKAQNNNGSNTSLTDFHPFYDAVVYYFSATPPSVPGNYWHYDGSGKPAIWE